MTAARQLADGIDWLIDLVGRIVSWLALAVALVMGANVLLRYGFSLGWIWAQELEWHLLVPLTLVGMSYALRHGEHVRVDVLFDKFDDTTKRAIDVVSSAIGLAMVAPVVPVIAAAIYLESPGPVIFKQKRAGQLVL